MSRTTDLIKSIHFLGLGEEVYNVEKIKKSFEDLQYTLPNLQDIAITVTWFIEGLDVGEISVAPRVENYNQNDNWEVAGLKKDKVQRVCIREDSSLCSGGTTSDKELLILLKFLKDHSYNITLIPTLMVDAPNQPWRGNIAPTSVDGEKEIQDFFNKNGYNDFIKYYAYLSRDYVDNFVIGTELKGITTYRNFGSELDVGVEELIKLSAEVRNILGSPINIIYAANWGDEYHHVRNGEYPLDKLWCNPNIDKIGISAYFPITPDLDQTQINQAKIFEYWQKGEGVEYYLSYYRDKKYYFDNQDWAWKNLAHWWSNNHYEHGKKTCWEPKSKKVIFMEYGFSSVDGTANESYKYYDKYAADGGLPRKSQGIPDNKAQADAICATLLFLNKNLNQIVEQSFLYYWDARNLDNASGDSDFYKKSFNHDIYGKITNDHYCDIANDYADL